MKFRIGLIFIVLLFAGFVHAITVESTGDIPTDPSLAQSAQINTLMQKVSVLDVKVSQLPTNDQIDQKLNDKLTLEVQFLNKKVQDLILINAITVISTVVMVASIYFLLRSRGRL